MGTSTGTRLAACSSSSPTGSGRAAFPPGDTLLGRQVRNPLVIPLTTRETDVLRLLAEFCSNEEIAADLVLSLNTVKTHMRSLFQKLSVTRRADAVRRGRVLGLC